MPLTKKVNGVSIALTPEEESEIKAEWASYDAGALGRAQEVKKANINSARNEKEALPTKFESSTYDSEFLLSIVGDVALMNDTETKIIITEENSEKSLTKNELLSLIIHLRDRNTSLVHAGRTQKNEVLALTSVEEVKDYVIVF